MTEQKTEAPFGDPLSYPFWEAASEHRLVVQHCRACGNHQFYPRPFCLKCRSSDLDWVEPSGTGTVYSVTTVRLNVMPELPPPYQVAIVELDEGVRMLGGIVGDTASIGDRVEVRWRDRDGMPPLPMFAVA